MKKTDRQTDRPKLRQQMSQNLKQTQKLGTKSPTQTSYEKYNLRNSIEVLFSIQPTLSNYV